ncbi:hypothetical protein [Corynebacterium vitaeruminis]|uniref:hypothetical protein n=1 Tax=Corynebacterium vitaeruminis TaxID=38305 RepID=UPI0005597B53|nr:hypothetical protein [Corynebacterium vitaeruminis]
MSAPIFTRTRSGFTSTFTNFHRPQVTPASQEPQQSTTRIFADDPFRARFGHKLPTGLRQEARGMQWRTFVSTYAPATDLRIQFTDITKLRGSHLRYTADITRADGAGRTTETREIVASGPISACTNLLADMGRRIEIHSFHQFEIFEATVTFIYAGNNNKKHWAMGFGGTPEQSAAAAMASAAELIYG